MMIGAAAMAESAVGNLREEAARLARESERLAADHAVLARSWRRVNVLLAAPAAVLAAATASGFAFADQGTIAGSLALASGLAALASFLGSARRAEAHTTAWAEYGSLARKARRFGRLDALAEKDVPRLIGAFEELAERRTELDAKSPPHERLLPGRRILAITAGLIGLLAAAGIGAAVWLAGSDETGKTDIAVALAELSPPTNEVLPIDGELATRFAPIIRLATGERFFPMDRGRYVTLTNVLRKTGRDPAERQPFSRKLADLPETATCPAGKECAYFLDVEGLTPRQGPAAYAVKQKQLYPADRPLVYWNVTHYESGETAIQYWLFYLFNDFHNWHEADWEEITIRLDPELGPVEAFYSSHQGGKTKAWADTRKVGERPVVFVARGSHANYFTVGKHPVRLECKLGTKRSRFCADVLRKIVRDNADGCGRLLAASDVATVTAVVTTACDDRGLKLKDALEYQLEELKPPSFVGFYAFGNFLVEGRIPVGEKGPSEPQRRAEWKDPLRLVVTERQ